MMNTLSWLGAILVIQLVLVIGLFSVPPTHSDPLSQQALLAFDRQGLDRLVLSDAEQSLTLERLKGRWRLPDWQGLPVSDTKLSTLLDKLKQLKTPWPVADSDASHQRFQVTDTLYQRKISLQQEGGKPEVLYLGSSPGFRKVHSRVGGESHVYALALNHYEFPLKAEDWLDRKLLKLEAVKAIEGMDFMLTTDSGNWRFKDAVHTVDGGKAQALAQSLKDLNVLGMAQEAVDMTAGTALNVTALNGQKLTYNLLAGDGQYYLQRDDWPHRVYRKQS